MRPSLPSNVLDGINRAGMGGGQGVFSLSDPTVSDDIQVAHGSVCALYIMCI